MLFDEQLERVTVASLGALHEVQPRFLPASTQEMPRIDE